jgi:hypothetical protein
MFRQNQERLGSAEELAGRMNRPKKHKTRSGKHLHAGVLVRAPDAEREAWEAAAAAAGLDRSGWIRGELNAAAARQADIDSILTPAQRRARKKGR